MARPTLYLCGAGNPEGVRLALRVNAAEGRWDRIAVLDDDPSQHGRRMLGVEVLGPFELLENPPVGAAECVNLVAGTTALRKTVHERLAATGVPLVGLIDPHVDVTGTQLAPDVLVYGNATVAAEAVVESGVVVLMGGIVGHGSHIGPWSIIAPNAVVNARVQLGECVYVGTNASILPDLTVNSGATVGSNTAVISEVPAGATVIGVPGRVFHLSGKRTAPPALLREAHG